MRRWHRFPAWTSWPLILAGLARVLGLNRSHAGNHIGGRYGYCRFHHGFGLGALRAGWRRFLGWTSRPPRKGVCWPLVARAALAAATVWAMVLWPAVAAAAPAPFRVVLDAGHGGSDPGAIAAGRQEKDITLRLAQLAGAALQQQGVQVVYTRTDDRFVPLEARVATSDRVGADALVSIHLNAAENPAAGGAEVWYGDSPSDADLAVTILSALQPVLQGFGVATRGARPGPELAVMRAGAPAVLVEVAYLTNPHEAQLLEQERFLSAVANALATGIVRFRDGPRSLTQAAASGPATSTGRLLMQPLLVGAAAARTVYAVAPGDTLSDIALRVGRTVADLARLNGIADPNRILAGQALRLVDEAAAHPPAGGGAGASTPSTGRPDSYVVAPGDTLSTIALRYGVSVPDLARWNGIEDVQLVRAGERLRLAPPDGTAAAAASKLPAPGATRRYRVQEGDTLFSLSRRFGVSVEALQRANNLSDPDRLIAGTEIAIPGGTAV